MIKFSHYYDKILNWASHKHAKKILAGLSFSEAIFFPIPPDVMLIPMGLAKPASALKFALITTLFSVLGGIFGYFLGLYAFDFLIAGWVESAGYSAAYQQVLTWFTAWGFISVLVAGFTPIPYKLFTIAAGVLHLNPGLFLLASIIGRGSRFFLVAGLIQWGGENFSQQIRYLIDRTGWLMVGVVCVLFGLIKWV